VINEPKVLTEQELEAIKESAMYYDKNGSLNELILSGNILKLLDHIACLQGRLDSRKIVSILTKEDNHLRKKFV